MEPRNYFGLIIALLLFAFPGWGDEASKAAKVEEFFRLSRLQETMEATMEGARHQLNTQMLQQIVDAKMPEELQEDFDHYQDRVLAVLDEALGWEAMRPEFVRMYVDAFTEEELDAIVGFYRSPVGQSMVEKTPQLMARAFQVSEQRLAVVAPRLGELSREWRALVKERLQPDGDGEDAPPKP